MKRISLLRRDVRVNVASLPKYNISSESCRLPPNLQVCRVLRTNLNLLFSITLYISLKSRQCLLHKLTRIHIIRLFIVLRFPPSSAGCRIVRHLELQDRDIGQRCVSTEPAGTK